MKITILLAKNDAYVSEKCEKSYFLTKYRISAQNRTRPRSVCGLQLVAMTASPSFQSYWLAKAGTVNLSRDDVRSILNVERDFQETFGKP